MNKKGFTLIELLAIIIILGAIMTIVVVSITGNINKSKDESFVDLAKNYAESVRTMRSNGELYYEPKKDEVLIIPYDQVKGLEINNSLVTGYGKILPTYCFIGVINNNNNYSYFINQVDESYHILDRKNYNSVSKEDVQASEDILSTLAQVKTPLSSFNINYSGNNYSLKGVRVEFSSKYKKEANTFITNFDLSDRGITFKGRLSLFNWTNDSSKRIELKIENNKIGELSNTTYTFKRESAGAYGIWKAVNGSGNQLYVNGKTLELDIKTIANDYVVFDLRIDNQIKYEGIKTTSDVILSGYYTKDSSYTSSNAQIRGNITAYDNYVNAGIPLASNNEFSIDGIKYIVNGSKIQYIVVKK